MFNVIIKTFIKDYKNTTHYKVRERYGIVCSVLSIICNSFMVVFKLLFGFMIHSVALQADGFNNLSDVGSNLATLFGFKLASKHPDSDHPYGHGRYEYIAGLVISFLILMVGFSSAKESLLKMIEPTEVLFEWSAIIVIIVSILIKLWMFYFNNKAGMMIDSTSLKAAGQDSLNDVLTSSATLISIILGLFTDLPVDGFIGLIVSIIVLKSGIEIFHDTVNPLLGMAPDKELVNEIHKFVMNYDKVIGIHDFMMHDYGPGRKYLTFHAEVDSHEDIVDVHEQLDKMERDILNDFNILTTIHMDPIDIHDERTLDLKMKVAYIVDEINENYSIHDFRVVYGKRQSKLIFDVLIPSDDTTKHSIIRKEIEKKIKELDDSYNCVIQVEHSFI
ncbi:MAG: cation diffusion facilitator family transporter [Bacilli bacterium]|nr:cation diffusion facilitator family transporter [Bacilli bacterium]